MALAGIFAGLFTSYLRAALSSYSGIGRMGAAAGLTIGDFNNVFVSDLKNGTAYVDVADLIALENALKNVGPEFQAKFRRDAAKVGKPARDEIQKVFKQIGNDGPLGGPQRKRRRYDRFATSEVGRLSWYNSRIMSENKAIDVNYKNRNSKKDQLKLASGQDAALSIVRVRVKAPAYIVADIAGASGTAKKVTGEKTRQYQINLFGKGVITRDHRVNSDNVDNWIRALNEKAVNSQQNKPSRYAWPTMVAFGPKHRENTSRLLNETIFLINDKLATREMNKRMMKG